METLNHILKPIKPNCYMASLDIKDAYYIIPVAEEFQKYLKFIWKGKLLNFVYYLMADLLASGGSLNYSNIQWEV